MAITLADFNKIWASTSPLTPYSFSEANYKQGWNFIGATPPARQMWDFLQKNNDEKMQYLANNYLPLSGGTMTGAITSNATAITNSSNDSYTQFNGSTSGSNGASLVLFGKDNASSGSFSLRSHNGNAYKYLVGSPDGTLTWNNSNVLTAANYNSYALPLSGGTISGTVDFSKVDLNINKTENTGFLAICGGAGSGNGSRIVLRGKNRSGNEGYFDISADNGILNKSIQGRPDGTLTWNGQPIQTSSDKRLKQDFSDVPADVLEAWGKVEWKQFKYKADVERKGDKCRFHTGLVAQDVQEVCGDEILKYGILCHDVREAVEEEKDEDGNVIREASEAGDLWTVRYEEALAMEVIYLRNEIKKLREEIKALRTE